MNAILKEELMEFNKYHFPKYVMTDLETYYRAKEAYIERQEDDFIEHWYDMIYTSLKSQWVGGKISEATFWHLVSLLRHGV